MAPPSSSPPPRLTLKERAITWTLGHLLQDGGPLERAELGLHWLGSVITLSAEVAAKSLKLALHQLPRPRQPAAPAPTSEHPAADAPEPPAGRALYQHVAHPHIPRNANHVHAAERDAAGFNQRLAVAITKRFGSIWAFYALVLWMLGWMSLATLHVGLFAKDSYPFQFLLFLSNLVQLWALPVLAVGQIVLGRHAEIQADETYKTTMKNHHEQIQMMRHLNAQDDQLLQLAERADRQDAELLKQTAYLVELHEQVVAKAQARNAKKSATSPSDGAA